MVVVSFSHASHLLICMGKVETLTFWVDFGGADVDIDIF